jgi:hypothetical protein
MPKKAVICYLSSLILYGLGYSTTLGLERGFMNSYDYTFYISLATVYFVLSIFFAVIGSIFLYLVKAKAVQEQSRPGFYQDYSMRYIKYKGIGDPASTCEMKESPIRYKYRDDWKRRMSS